MSICNRCGEEIRIYPEGKSEPCIDAPAKPNEFPEVSDMTPGLWTIVHVHCLTDYERGYWDGALSKGPGHDPMGPRKEGVT